MNQSSAIKLLRESVAYFLRHPFFFLFDATKHASYIVEIVKHQRSRTWSYSLWSTSLAELVRKVAPNFTFGRIILINDRTRKTRKSKQIYRQSLEFRPRTSVVVVGVALGISSAYILCALENNHHTLPYIQQTYRQEDNQHYLLGSTKHVAGTSPQFNWSYYSADNNKENAFQIQVGTSENGSDMWGYTSAITENRWVTYAGSNLTRGVTYYVRVRVQDNTGAWGDNWFEDDVQAQLASNSREPRDRGLGESDKADDVHPNSVLGLCRP